MAPSDSTSWVWPKAYSRAARSPAAFIAPSGKVDTIPLLCRIDTLDELEYFRHGGILQYVLRNPADAA